MIRCGLNTACKFSADRRLKLTLHRIGNLAAITAEHL